MEGLAEQLLHVLALEARQGHHVELLVVKGDELLLDGVLEALDFVLVEQVALLAAEGLEADAAADAVELAEVGALEGGLDRELLLEDGADLGDDLLLQVQLRVLLQQPTDVLLVLLHALRLLEVVLLLGPPRVPRGLPRVHALARLLATRRLAAALLAERRAVQGTPELGAGTVVGDVGGEPGGRVGGRGLGREQLRLVGGAGGLLGVLAVATGAEDALGEGLVVEVLAGRLAAQLAALQVATGQGEGRAVLLRVHLLAAVGATLEGVAVAEDVGGGQHGRRPLGVGVVLSLAHVVEAALQVVEGATVARLGATAGGLGAGGVEGLLRVQVVLVEGLEGVSRAALAEDGGAVELLVDELLGLELGAGGEQLVQRLLELLVVAQLGVAARLRALPAPMVLVGLQVHKLGVLLGVGAAGIEQRLLGGGAREEAAVEGEGEVGGAGVVGESAGPLAL
mmetsp:Transcript_11198/g.18826  ORF Transcript_11198/g.18826 Transcript_11198/m.18826 type:complete len:454 (-) Transcript_11198:5-1366(-)